MMILRKWAAVAACLALSSVAIAEAPNAVQPLGLPNSQGAPVPGGNQAQAQNAQQGTADQTPVQKNADQPQQQQAGGRDDRKGNDSVRVGHSDDSSPEALTAKFTFWLFIVTALLAAATFALSVATIGLYRETRRLADQAVEASADTKESIAIAKRSAEAAEKSVEIALLGISSQQAVVVQKGFNDGSIVNSTIYGTFVDYAFIMDIEWFNAGPTVAINFDLFFRIYLVDKSDQIPQLDYEFPDKVSGVSLGTGVTAKTRYDYIKHVDMIEIMHGNKEAYICSAARYNTIQDPTEMKITKFQAKLMVNKANMVDKDNVEYIVSLGTA